MYSRSQPALRAARRYGRSLSCQLPHPVFAVILNQTAPIVPLGQFAPVDQKPVTSDQGCALLNRLQNYSFRRLLDLQVRPRLQAIPVPDRLRQDDAARSVDFQGHAISTRHLPSRLANQSECGRLTAVYMKVPKGYIAFAEELPGANTQGATLDEARANLNEAVTLILDANRTLSEQSIGEAEVIREKFVLPAA